jgi:plasmid replication initiation protein
MTKNNTPKILKSHTPKVYKNNKLNNANFGDFTLNDYQVFLHLVSKIGGVDEFGKYLQQKELQREHVLTAKEFHDAFNTDIDYSYKVLKKSVDKLMKTDIKLETSEDKCLTRINICSKAEYNKSEGRITIKFTDDIMPYLSQVREKFVLYNLKEISNFRSIYTTRFYELIQQFKETGWIIKSVDQLREFFAVGENFPKYHDFKKRTFDRACQEINANYRMNLCYEEIKEGRKIIAIKFVFKKTKVHKVVNQKTGIEKNYYEKPKSIDKVEKDILSQTEENLPSEGNEDSQHIKNILSKMLNKITIKKT